MISGPSMLMMTLPEQIYVFLRAILMGVFFGALYDFFRVTRVIFGVRYSSAPVRDKKRKTFPYLDRLPVISSGTVSVIRSVTVIIGDVIFFVICGVGMSVFIYRYCSGIIRFYVFPGAVLGFAAYYNSIGRLVIYVSDAIVFFILSVIKRLLYIILFPFAFLSDRIRKSIKNKRKKAENESE